MGANNWSPKHVVIVMNALKEFSLEPIELVLKNISTKERTFCTITVLGFSPWLNLPMRYNSGSIWPMGPEDLLATREDSDEWRNNDKSRQFQRLVELCQKYEVHLPKVSFITGIPLKVILAERIASLHATLTVFDKHHDPKHVEYYAKNAPCNIIVLRGDHQEADIIYAADHTASDASTS